MSRRARARLPPGPTRRPRGSAPVTPPPPSARQGADAARLEGVAAAAAEEAQRVFSILSQLDSLAWAARRVRDIAGPTPMGAPAGAAGAEAGGGEGWRLRRRRRRGGGGGGGGGGEGAGWKSAFLGSPGMAAFRRSFCDDMRDNLER